MTELRKGGLRGGFNPTVTELRNGGLMGATGVSGGVQPHCDRAQERGSQGGYNPTVTDTVLIESPSLCLQQRLMMNLYRAANGMVMLGTPARRKMMP